MSAEPGAAETVSTPQPIFPFFSRRMLADWSMRLAGFGAVQTVVQLALAVAGLIIIRALPKTEYALFAIANSMQVACTQLADLGIGIGVRSIGGKIWTDRVRLGQLVNTALGLRRQFATVSMIVCVPILAWLLQRNHASALQTVALCVVVIAAAIPLLGISVWTAVLLLHGDYKRVQKQDLCIAGLRVGLVGALALSRISAVLAAAVGLVNNVIQATFVRRWARTIADPQASKNLNDRRELLRLSRKSLPNTIFFCFQGQITIFILTLLGSPTGIADITALGRLALLFSVFAVMFGNVLVPRFARCQNRNRLGKLYFVLIGGTTLALGPICIAAGLFPAPFLWLLGNKYAGLERECVWVIGAGCISQIAAAMWALNSSKAWINIQSKGYIAVVIFIQVLLAMIIDLRQFHNVVLFAVATAAAPIPLQIIDAFIGLRNSVVPRDSSYKEATRQ